MRWHSDQPTERKRRGFLLLPKTINRETRWLEWASWSERDYNLPNYFGWKPIKWESA